MNEKKEKYISHQWENVNCPFCNSNKSKFYEKYGCDLQFTNVKCKQCGLVYQSPRPKYDEVFLQAAYSEYINFNENYSCSDKTLNKWNRELQEIIKYDKLRTNILDVGCAMGDFLLVAKKHYVNCFGVEVAENMANYVKNNLSFEVYRDDYTIINFNEKYSCIHLSHVIEHIPNPKEWLISSKKILLNNGILVINVPNKYSLIGKVKLFLVKLKLRSGRWKDVSRTPDHLFEPTVKSMKRFLEVNGFRVLEYYTYSRKDVDAKSLFGRIYNRRLKLGSNIRYFVTPLN